MTDETRNAEPLRRLLRFDEPPAEYELLENEQGEPPFFGGWRSGARQTARRESAVPPVSAQLEGKPAPAQRRVPAATSIPTSSCAAFRWVGRCARGRRVLRRMADAARINDFILRPAMRRGAFPAPAMRRLRSSCSEHVLAMQDAALTADWEEVRTAVSEGRCALLVDGDAQAIVMDTRGFPGRTVTEPRNETVILGPHEAFTENIRTNISLLRKIIRTDDSCASSAMRARRTTCAWPWPIARASPTARSSTRSSAVSRAWTRSRSSPSACSCSSSRSTRIRPSPQSLITERPDRTASALMDGHVAILVEGSPQACVMPVTFFMLMTSAEEAYLRPVAVSIIRLVRYLGAFFSTILRHISSRWRCTIRAC